MQLHPSRVCATYSVIVVLPIMRMLLMQYFHSRYFKTPMTTQYSTDPKYKDFNDYILSRTPAKRWGEPQDLQGAVIFLASKASDYISGTSVVCDGGFMGM